MYVWCGEHLALQVSVEDIFTPYHTFCVPSCTWRKSIAYCCNL